MNTKRAGVELPSQLLSNRLILGIIASYGLAFIVFGFLMSSPGEILNGLIEIITTASPKLLSLVPQSQVSFYYSDSACSAKTC
ncbi:MAG: hypothetical protein GPJ14_25520 [Microcystis aeruginosa G11-01]|nr:hypothetical protein [Microcystis aeruginosa G11-01]